MDSPTFQLIGQRTVTVEVIEKTRGRVMEGDKDWGECEISRGIMPGKVFSFKPKNADLQVMTPRQVKDVTPSNV